MTKIRWVVGQAVTINRAKVGMVECVTASGRAHVGARTFDKNGRERTAQPYHERALLEILTPEIEAEMALEGRGNYVSRELNTLLDNTQQWVRMSFDIWRRKVPNASDIDKAEKIIAALKGTFGDE